MNMVLTLSLVQSDLFADHTSVAVLLMSSDIVAAPLICIDVEASDQNGLHALSQIAINKMFTVRREKIGGVIGQIEDETMIAVNRAMVVFYGLA